MMSGRYGFYVDSRSCTGCKACQIACKDKNNLAPGLKWRRVVEVSGGGWTRQGAAVIHHTATYFVSTACMHCEKPICVEACPTRAMTQRPDGIVTLDRGRCMGCGYCRWACPYGAPQPDEAAGVMTKCDLCADELDQGRLPACVRACQMRVIEVGDIEALRGRYGTADAVFPLPEAALTRPAVVFTPHRDALGGRGAPLVIGNREEL